MMIPLVLALATQLSGSKSDNRVTQAAIAAACPVDHASPFAAALERFPGQDDPSLKIVATVSGAADADRIGTLCAAIVREQGDRFTAVATLPPADRPDPPGEVDPVTNVYVGIDGTPFRFMPGEIAFAVRATGEYNSTSTNMGWSTLYLFRRIGRRLMPIFDARIEDQTIDKTAVGQDVHRRWIVRFDARQHRGAYDLLLDEVGHHRLRRFVWNGQRYAASPGGTP